MEKGPKNPLLIENGNGWNSHNTIFLLLKLYLVGVNSYFIKLVSYLIP